MSSTPHLYDLLPAYVRFRDFYEGQPLRTLMAALEQPYRAVEENIDELARAWFIETCELWMVPYIADLVGVRGLSGDYQLQPRQRTRVANTIAYRRRKGTPAVLERVCQDVSGWYCHVVDYREVMAMTQCLRHVRPGRGATVEVRRSSELDRLGTPFNVIAHTVDLKPTSLLRRRGSGDVPVPLGDRGGFNLPNLGVTYWRLNPYPMFRGTPRQVRAGQNGLGEGYTFHPFGIDIPLFNQPVTADGPVYESEERNLPTRLRRQVLAREVAELRRVRGGGEGYFERAQRVFRILSREEGEEGYRPVDPEAMSICDLSQWRPPLRPARGGGEVRTFTRWSPVEPAKTLPLKVAVDPQLGRFLFLEEGQGRQVQVDYSYGLAADLGGGPYPRRDSLIEPSELTWHAVVSSRYEGSGEDHERGVFFFRTLDEAVDAWNATFQWPIPTSAPDVKISHNGVIQIADSATYEVRRGLIVDLRHRCLAIEAADGFCPCLRGDLRVRGPLHQTELDAGDKSEVEQSRVSLDGLWIEGKILLAGELQLEIEHCTVRPPREGGKTPAAIEGGRISSPRYEVTISRSIVGGIALMGDLPGLNVSNSIVDGGQGDSVSGPASAQEGTGLILRAQSTTFLGPVWAHQIPLAVNVLFTDPVRLLGPWDGKIRHSYVPYGSSEELPLVRCTRGRALHGLHGLHGDSGTEPEESREMRVIPSFTSTTFGDPGYGQLSPSCPPEIATGGENGNEVGAFHDLLQADRLVRLRPVLNEYVPWGLEDRVSFVT